MELKDSNPYARPSVRGTTFLRCKELGKRDVGERKRIKHGRVEKKKKRRNKITRENTKRNKIEKKKEIKETTYEPYRTENTKQRITTKREYITERTQHKQ